MPLPRATPSFAKLESIILPYLSPACDSVRRYAHAVVVLLRTSSPDKLPSITDVCCHISLATIYHSEREVPLSVKGFTRQPYQS